MPLVVYVIHQFHGSTASLSLATLATFKCHKQHAAQLLHDCVRSDQQQARLLCSLQLLSWRGTEAQAVAAKPVPQQERILATTVQL